MRFVVMTKLEEPNFDVKIIQNEDSQAHVIEEYD
jgi:hypothetical protein